jgi:hypothetical protein
LPTPANITLHSSATGVGQRRPYIQLHVSV